MKPPVHLHSVRRRFSSAAYTYERNARVQARAAERLLGLCAELHPDRVLEAGCGTGLLTRGLLRQFPAARIDAIDVSDRMIRFARAKTPDHERLLWQVADVAAFPSVCVYELAVSNCALHWTEPLDAAFDRLRQALRPGGRLVFSLMLRDTFRELHDARAAIAPDKPPAARLPLLEEVLAAMGRAGFSIESTREEHWMEIHSSARDFLRTIHDMGLTGGRVSRAARPLARGELNRLIDLYETRHRRPDGVLCTYHLGFLTARK